MGMVGLSAFLLVACGGVSATGGGAAGTSSAGTSSGGGGSAGRTDEAGAGNASADKAGAGNAGADNADDGTDSKCTVDGDCTDCVFATAPRQAADCECICTGKRRVLSVAACDANEAAWRSVCTAVLMTVDCPKNECAVRAAMCEAGMCTVRTELP